MSYTGAWLRGRAALLFARRLLDRYGDAAACEALWRLNRWARSHRGRRVDQVYGMKNRMVRVLYERHGAEVHRDATRRTCSGSGTWIRLATNGARAPIGSSCGRASVGWRGGSGGASCAGHWRL